MTLYDSAALKENACVELIPCAFRKPDLHLCESVCHRLCYRSNEHIVTEHVLTAELLVISLLCLRPVVIKRAAEGYAIVISLAGHCVDVWRHVVTLTYCLTDHVGIFL